jgi:hypothetical protein
MTRKELAHRLAEHLETTPVYLAAPSFAYQVGDYTVDRHGSILDAQGQVVELEELLEGGSKEEMELETLEVQIPLEGYDGKSLRNFLHLIYNNQPLIKKALGLKSNLVSEEIIAALEQEKMFTLDHFNEAMAGVNCPYIDFDYDKETITFKLDTDENNPEKVQAATQLFGLTNISARRLKRNISAKIKPTDNEKYTFRIWLLRLGMIGDEYKLARKVLLKNLSGNSSFRTQAKEGA